MARSLRALGLPAARAGDWVGRVIETELERDDGRWVYEFRLLPPSGQVFQLKLDAATGALLRSRGPVQERR